MKDIIIIGAGGFGREVEMLIHQINLLENQWNLMGFVDDNYPPGTKIGRSVVVGPILELAKFTNSHYVIAVADARKKKSILELVPASFSAAVLKHPSVISGERVRFGNGAIVCAGSILTEDIVIGNHVILNLSCTVGHDTAIGDLCSIMPGASISGEVIIREGVFVGTGSKVINQVEIGENSIIGAGAIVSESIPANCTAVGIPAKPIKFHE